MKEIQIISKYQDIEILAQILDGEIAMISDNLSDNAEPKKDEFFCDNDKYIFALFKVLKEVDKKGGFDHLKEEEEEEADIEKFYV